jgi:hypothetical protein
LLLAVAMLWFALVLVMQERPTRDSLRQRLPVLAVH